jgi:hypothetical protein
LETLRTTLDVYAPIFDHAVARNARALIDGSAVPDLFPAGWMSRSP